jgi:hypothetical protein
VLQGVHTLFESVETCRNLVESAGKIIHLFHPMKTEARVINLLRRERGQNFQATVEEA